MVEDISIVDADKEGILLGLAQNLEIIDPGMRSLVQRINALPFLYTNYSCSGHMEKIAKNHLKVNQMPALGVQLASQDELTLRRYAADFMLFGWLVENSVNEVNGKYFDRFETNVAPIRKSSQNGFFVTESGNRIHVPCDFLFSFSRMPKGFAELGVELLNGINEGFHRAVSCFETGPTAWKPISIKDYLKVGPHNFYSQTERAREMGLL